jgi:hypothetical protein
MNLRVRESNAAFRSQMSECLVTLALRCAPVLVLSMALGGCTLMGQYQRYERPPLFYPTTAILKQEIELGLSPAPAAPPAPAASEPPEMLALNEIATNDSTLRDIRVSDQCADGQAPILHAEPAAMIVTRFTAEPGTTHWFKATFDASKVPDYIGDLDITVIGCGAANLSLTLARDRGLITTARVRIGYKRLVTNYNLWAQGDIESEFGTQFASTFTVADVVFENPNDRPILVYGSSLRAQVRFLAAVDDVKAVLGTKAIENPALLGQYRWGDRLASEALDFTEYVRPMAYSDILAIFSYQQEADPRQRTISSLKSVGELAAGAAVFVTGADYGSGVAIFTGVLIPELEKQLLWDVLKHLKNLESRSLKEVEEIPERGELRRVVFFPKRAIPNFLPPFPMYIAEITAENVPVKAVLLDKKATITSGDAAAEGS